MTISRSERDAVDLKWWKQNRTRDLTTAARAEVASYLFLLRVRGTNKDFSFLFITLEKTVKNVLKKKP